MSHYFLQFVLMLICETVASASFCIYNADCISDLQQVQVCAKVIFSSVQVSFYFMDFC